jgi:hypothetical protein
LTEDLLNGECATAIHVCEKKTSNKTPGGGYPGCGGEEPAGLSWPVHPEVHSAVYNQ